MVVANKLVQSPLSLPAQRQPASATQSAQRNFPAISKMSKRPQRSQARFVKSSNCWAVESVFILTNHVFPNPSAIATALRMAMDLLTVS